MLGVELHHFLIQFLGVVFIFFANLFHRTLELRHLLRGALLSGSERPSNQFNNHREYDNGPTPRPSPGPRQHRVNTTQASEEQFTNRTERNESKNFGEL